MMAIFSGGHLLALYLYQLPLSQQLVPADDIYARYRSVQKVGFTFSLVLVTTVSPVILPVYFYYACIPRLFGMTGVIKTTTSDPHSLGLHPHVSWPDFINPLVLLLLYYTLVALLHRWVHITEEVWNNV